MRISEPMKLPAVVCTIALLVSTAFSQETPPGTPATAGDIKLIRQILEQQSRQIETLTQQVESLVQLLKESQRHAPGIGAAPSPEDMPPGAPGIAEEAIPVLPATPARRTHVVIKGESFSSIADQYGISVTELMKLNPMQDPRKMQIGQTLLLPIEETPPDRNTIPAQPTPPPSQP
jgi:LysM repeat protein